MNKRVSRQIEANRAGAFQRTIRLPGLIAGANSLQRSEGRLFEEDGVFGRDATDTLVLSHPVNTTPAEKETPELVTVASWNMSGLLDFPRMAGYITESVRPDILALQGAPHAPAFEAFYGRFGEGDPYPYRVVVTSDSSATAGGVALVSRLPIRRVHSYCQLNVKHPTEPRFSEKFPFAHSPLYAVIEVVPGFQLHLAVCQLRAKQSNEQRKELRVAEAWTFQHMVRSFMTEFPERLTLVTGVFNADIHSGLVKPISYSMKNPFKLDSRRVEHTFVSRGLMGCYEEGSADILDSPSGHNVQQLKFRVS